MKKNKIVLLLVLSSILITSGCSHFHLNFRDFLGDSIKDLKRARSTGKVQIFDGSYSEVFSKITTKLEKKSIKIYLSNEKEGYIITMGFTKQVNTTRVGIFFEDEEDNKIKVTLSSLSEGALVKAEKIIFGQ